MSFIDDFKSEEKQGSHEITEKKSNRKLKPRFSVNLSDSDYEEVKAYCESRGISCASLARVLILDEIKSKLLE